jgi:2-C-methyl-D-erythritol 2,4-cyclodiphosphate synthase
MSTPRRDWPEMRIGLGHDIHALVPERPLILGGVTIPFDKGLDGHSDADALLHAIMDALLGAANLADIGTLFPNTDPAFKNISSVLLTERVVEKVAQLGYSVENVDTIIHCERPKIKPFRDAMQNTIARALQIRPDQVSIKAGTNEGFDAVGRGEAVVCQAVVLLLRSPRPVSA